MDNQTTETITEITQRYELYKDIVKIGLGALIGALASFITIFIKNRHELKKIDKENENQTTKHKLEIKVRILEESIESINKFFDEHHKFKNNLYKIRKCNKRYIDLKEDIRKKIANSEEFELVCLELRSGMKKLILIGAEELSENLRSYANQIINDRNKLFNSTEVISFSDEEWNKYISKYNEDAIKFDRELNNFFNQLK